MKDLKITCDQCGRDLTTTGNCEDFRIAVVNERITVTGGAVTSMSIEPHLQHDYHFCGCVCLRNWATTKL